MCVKELGLIFCLLFSWLDLLFVIWYLGVYRSAIIPVRCLPVQVRCLDMGKLDMGWILFGASRLPYLCFSKLILWCRIVLAMLTVIFVCLYVKQTIWGTQHLPFLVLFCGFVYFRESRKLIANAVHVNSTDVHIQIHVQKQPHLGWTCLCFLKWNITTFWPGFCLGPFLQHLMLLLYRGISRALRIKAPCTDLIDGLFTKCCAATSAYNIQGITHVFQWNDSSQWRKSIPFSR